VSTSVRRLRRRGQAKSWASAPTFQKKKKKKEEEEEVEVEEEEEEEGGKEGDNYDIMPVINCLGHSSSLPPCLPTL